MEWCSHQWEQCVHIWAAQEYCGPISTNQGLRYLPSVDTVCVFEESLSERGLGLYLLMRFGIPTDRFWWRLFVQTTQRFANAESVMVDAKGLHVVFNEWGLIYECWSQIREEDHTNHDPKKSFWSYVDVLWIILQRFIQHYFYTDWQNSNIFFSIGWIISLRFINVFLVSCWPQKRFFLSYKELKLTVTILISVKLWKKRLEYDRKQGFCVSNFQSESRKTKCVCARATAYVTFIRCWITSNHTPRSSESLAHANLLLTLPMNKDAEQTHTQAKRTHTHKQKHRCVRAKTICTEQERFSIDGKNTWSEQEKIAR